MTLLVGNYIGVCKCIDRDKRARCRHRSCSAGRYTCGVSVYGVAALSDGTENNVCYSYQTPMRGLYLV